MVTHSFPYDSLNFPKFSYDSRLITLSCLTRTHVQRGLTQNHHYPQVPTAGPILIYTICDYTAMTHIQTTGMLWNNWDSVVIHTMHSPWAYAFTYGKTALV